MSQLPAPFDAGVRGNAGYQETSRGSAAGFGGVDASADRHNGLVSWTSGQNLNGESRKRKSKAPAFESYSSDSQRITTKKRKAEKEAAECSGY